MDVLSIIDVNKPDKVKETLNELINYKNNAQEIPNITKNTLGLDKVDNTEDANKPLSSIQKQYVDNETAKLVKLDSDTKQEVDSNIELGEGKGLFIKRGNGNSENAVSVQNDQGYESMKVGSKNIPLNLQHSMIDINDTVMPKNPRITINNAEGNEEEDGIALTSDLEALETTIELSVATQISQKVDKAVMAGSEVANGIVSQVEGEGFGNENSDTMNLIVRLRNIGTGALIRSNSIPLKLSSVSSRGLMSKEQVVSLNDVISRVGALEGQNSRLLYSENQNPNATQIDAFARSKGKTSPYTGVVIVVKGTYHVWHYYDNDNIGWRDDGVDSVSIGTNSMHGIVKGTNQNGKIYIEQDGSMSLVGYDALVSALTNITNSVFEDIALTGGTNNGTLKLSLTVDGVTTTVDNITITGLGDAAFHDNSEFASANHTHSNYLTQHQDITGKENNANKSQDLSNNSTSTTLYPSNKAVVDYVEAIIAQNIITALGGDY